MIVRIILCLAIVCSVWATPEFSRASRSHGNEEAIGLVRSPVDMPAGVKVKEPSIQPLLFLKFIPVSFASRFARPLCYSVPECEPTRLVQFRTGLTRTPLLTTSA